MSSKERKLLVQVFGLVMALLSLYSGSKFSDLTALFPTSNKPTPTPLAGQVAGSSQVIPLPIVASTSATVTRVIDGDTIEVSTSGQVKKLRLIGIDTPETVDPRRSVECFGKEASAKTKELLDGKIVALEKDVSETDRYGRLLRYVYLDGVLINEVLVAEGYAEASAYPPDIARQAQFEAAEKIAREQQKGLWSPSICVTQ